MRRFYIPYPEFISTTNIYKYDSWFSCGKYEKREFLKHFAAPSPGVKITMGKI